MECQETMDYVEAAEFLGIPEKVLREWVQWDFRYIPYHKLGSGKRAEIGFFKNELDFWFKKNGGNFLRDKVQIRPNNRGGRPQDSRSKPDYGKKDNYDRSSSYGDR